MAELLGELDDRRLALPNEKRYEGVPEVVCARLAQTNRSRGGMEVAVAPVVPVVETQPLAVVAGEQSVVRFGADVSREPRGEVLAKCGEQIDRPVRASCLLHLELAKRDGLLDQDGVGADVAPLERKRLAGSRAAVCEDADQRCAERIPDFNKPRADSFDRQRIQRHDGSAASLARLANERDGVVVGIAPLDREREHRLEQQHRFSDCLRSNAVSLKLGAPERYLARRDVLETRLTEAGVHAAAPGRVVVEQRRLGQAASDVAAVGRPELGDGHRARGRRDAAAVAQLESEARPLQLGLLHGRAAATSPRTRRVGPADGWDLADAAVSESAPTDVDAWPSLVARHQP